jgi:hypothetical protein
MKKLEKVPVIINWSPDDDTPHDRTDILLTVKDKNNIIVPNESIKKEKTSDFCFINASVPLC